MRKKLNLHPSAESDTEADEGFDDLGDVVLIDLERVMATHTTARIKLPKDAIIEDHGHEIIIHRTDEDMGS